MTDSATGRKTTYYYDLIDRLGKYKEVGPNFEHSVTYTYDERNNLSKQVETVNGVERTAQYTYDYENRLTETDYGNFSEVVEYDSLGRLSRTEITQDDTTPLSRQIYYIGGGGFSATTTLPEIFIYQSAAGCTLYNEYLYDNDGNIFLCGTRLNFAQNSLSYPDAEYIEMTSLYHYDAENQLVREDNGSLQKTYVWTYDNAGNITSRQEYAFNDPYSAVTGTPLVTYTYTYGDDSWGDLLTAYNGVPRTYDEVGNLLTDGTWTYTWRNGRELASMTDGDTTWNYTYDANGMRTSRSNGTTTYNYVYNGSQLTQMTVGNDTLYFTYGLLGPTTVTWNGTTYYYALSAQGDVIGIFDEAGNLVVTYEWDTAWGYNPVCEGPLASTLGTLNPLRYRSYVYDTETGYYYLQSRYYDPKIGRFVNTDCALSGVGGTLQGYNMFAYCFNNPVNMVDKAGNWPSWNDITAKLKEAANWVNNNIIQPVVGFFEDIVEDVNNYDSNNQSEEKVLQSNYFSSYKGVPVLRTNGDRSGFFGAIFLTRETNDRSNPEDIVRHEYGHSKQWEQLDVLTYSLCIGLPSWQDWGTGPYYSKPWEITADIYGGVQSRNHSQGNIDRGFAYLEGSKIIGTVIWVFINR